MGTNMQRQAVPLIQSERPLVGTGAEWRAAVDSGDVISGREGRCGYRRVRRPHARSMNDDGTTSSYKLAKFQRSQPDHLLQPAPRCSTTASAWRPAPFWLTAPPPRSGDLALGKNLLIAFMAVERLQL